MDLYRVFGATTLIFLSQVASAVDYIHEEVWAVSGSSDQAGFGLALAAGDYNGDGLNDLAVSSTSACTDPTTIDGCVQIFLGTETRFEDTSSWTQTGLSGQRAGYHLSSGDVNADGFDDLLLTPGISADSELYLGSADGLQAEPTWSWTSSSDFTPGGVIVGEMDGDAFLEIAVTDTVSQTIEIYSGTLASLTPDYTITNTEHAMFGEGISRAGSPDGDIFDDLLVTTGAETSVNGAAWIFSGSSKGPIQNPMWSYELPSSDGLGFGFASTAIGDSNGDGDDDFVVSAPGLAEDGDTPRQGYVGVWHGDMVGPEEVPDRWVNFGMPEDNYGLSLAGGVDLADNTFADLAVGAPNAGETGTVYVHLGAFAGLESVPVVAISPTYPNTNAVHPRFGHAVATAEDEGTQGKRLLIASSRDYESGQVHAFTVSLDETGNNNTPNPNTSAPKDPDSFAERQCGCSSAGSANWVVLWLLYPVLLRRSGARREAL